MSLLDDLVAQSLESQKGAYIEQINSAKKDAELDLATQSYAIEKRAGDIAGFNIGATAPAYSTLNANVFVRDPFGGVQSGDIFVDAVQKTSPVVMIGLAVLGYFLFFKKWKKFL